MDKELVRGTINTLLNTIHNEQQAYNEALSKDEIFEIRKKIRVRIDELNQQLVRLYKSLEDLEKE